MIPTMGLLFIVVTSYCYYLLVFNLNKNDSLGFVYRLSTQIIWVLSMKFLMKNDLPSCNFDLL